MQQLCTNLQKYQDLAALHSSTKREDRGVSEATEHVNTHSVLYHYSRCCQSTFICMIIELHPCRPDDHNT